MRVRTPDIVRERLKSLHDTYGFTWREIAASDAYAGIPAGTLCAIAKGGPIPARYYAQLGLPFSTARVVAVSGPVPDGTQVPAAHWCQQCGSPFSPNHPRRKYCYICSPIRAARARDGADYRNAETLYNEIK